MIYVFAMPLYYRRTPFVRGTTTALTHDSVAMNVQLDAAPNNLNESHLPSVQPPLPLEMVRRTIS